MRISDTRTRWAQIGTISHITPVGKEYLLFGAGCHLVLLNVNSNTEQVYQVNNTENGDGVKCYIGHRSLNIFAFSENTLNPTIFVKSVPNFNTISCLKDGDIEDGYLAMSFSETSLLVTLSGLPKFALIIWNWRTGEKIAAQNTDITIDQQLLKCSLGNPIYVVQLGLNNNLLHLWDVFLCGKRTILTRHVIQVQRKCLLTDVLWTAEGGLFVLDSDGIVYTMQANQKLEKIITFSGIQSDSFSFTWYKGGIAIAGVNTEIKHFSKSGKWTEDWNLLPIVPVKTLISGRGETLITLSTKLNIMHVSQNQEYCKFIKNRGNQFNDFCIINPTGEYIVTLCNNFRICAIEIQSGEEVNSIEMDNKCLVIAENPHFPYVAVGKENGTLVLISAFKPRQLTKMCSFFLGNEPINSIYFNDCGRIFIAANIITGLFFILEGLPASTIQIVGSINMRRQIADYMITISKDCYRLFAIPVTSDKYHAGNKIIRYCVIKDATTNIKEYEFEQENFLYTKLCATWKLNRDRVFYGIPFLSKSLHQIEIKRSSNIAKVISTICSGHLLRQIQLNITKKFAITWGYDGFVIVRSCDFKKNIGLALPHHRKCGGVQKVVIDPYNKYIISLGYENILVCTELMDYSIDEGLQQELNNLLHSDAYNILFKRRTIGFAPEGEHAGLCWLEFDDITKFQKQRQLHQKERNEIFTKFKQIQEELQLLLTQNLNGPYNEKLEIVEFNLDKELYEEKKSRNKRLCYATKIYYKELIIAQNEVSKWLIVNFLNKMRTPGTTIQAIFENFFVENYVLLPENLIFEDLINEIREMRKLELHLNNLTPFLTSNPQNPEELEKLMNTQPKYSEGNEKLALIAQIGEDEKLEQEESKTDFNKEHEIAFSGSDVQRFIELPVIHYSQYEIKSYFQAKLRVLISENEARRLREYFNKEFDNIMSMKVREMYNIKEKNTRLRHIISELNYFSVDKFDIVITDPEWRQEETPASIKEVKDKEIFITPYISPSEQLILDAKAAEAERLRLLLLADDFRERALMVMMNGVLEVRWEDELKKDVPLPKCMIEKQPENFNEEDLRAIRDYEEKVKFLNGERERYKNMLQSEYTRVRNQLHESIKKFNLRLRNLSLLKMKVQAAISQETLRNNRIKLDQLIRLMLKSQEKSTGELITDNENVIKSIFELLNSLHETVELELKTQLEALQSRDKFLEKAFKKDFQDKSPVVQELVAKYYKRRPKVSFKGINSPTVLNELSKCIINSEILPTLTQECLDFLKSLDALDSYVGIPTTLDENTYSQICKHRRLRIEYEVKYKAITSDISEAQTTISIFQRRLAQKKELHNKLQAELAQIRSKLLTGRINTEVQIVLPSGLVEVPMTGAISDFEDCVLVARAEVENINKIILVQTDYGKKKLQAMRQTMTFRRRIITMEWEHEHMRMQIGDLLEKLEDIKEVKVTKEMQAYLKAQKMGKDNTLPFETEVDMIKASYENTIRERKDIVEKLSVQIQELKQDSTKLDKKIADINVDICECNLVKDQNAEAREKEIIESRMSTLLKRSNLVQEIQDNHNEILVLQTELELLRLKTFPTLKYKIFS